MSTGTVSAAPTRVALWALLTVRKTQRERFLALIGDLAVRSVADEPGCLAYDVILIDEDARTYGVYELYRNSGALAAHHSSPHYARWNAAAGSLIVPDGVVLRTGPVILSGATHWSAGGRELPASSTIRSV